MAQIKVNELPGVALDWAVAKCEGYEFEDDTYILVLQEEEGRLCYSSDWSWGGPIIDREGIDTLKLRHEGKNGWGAYHTPTPEAKTHTYTEGATALIAMMRCYVASKLGDVVEVPDALIK